MEEGLRRAVPVTFVDKKPLAEPRGWLHNAVKPSAFWEEPVVTTSADVAHHVAAAQPATARWSRFSAHQPAGLAAGLIIVLCALVVPPFLFLIQGSVTVTGSSQGDWRWGLENFGSVLRSRHFFN